MSTLAEHILPGREGRPGRGLPGDSRTGTDLSDTVRVTPTVAAAATAAAAAPSTPLWWQGALAS
ncbi:MAG: hypothetical protein RR720_02760, partial [Comamonas sp.]|uniref:hypothetical protein n=1 Tax=Comamonas sp. TaxID=34028 RepID=UPI002FC920C0